MRIFILFLFVININLYSDDGFDSFEDEFEQELVAKEKKVEVYDPLIGYNRFMTSFNDVLMIHVVEPVTTGYRFITPEQFRISVDNFFSNLYYPISVTNNLLQLKFEYSFTETVRFLANSTLGVLGLFDIADSWFDIKPHQEDFGQTLGHYGVGSGFPIVLPFFGQKNLRDLVGKITDNFIDPTSYATSNIEDDVLSYTSYLLISGYEDVNEYSLSDTSYEELTKGAIDLYPFIRDAYEQNRNKLIEE